MLNSAFAQTTLFSFERLRRNALPIAASLGLAFATVGCGRSSGAAPGKGGAKVATPDGEPVAVVDGVAITVADFRDRLNKQSPYIRARYTSLERKKEFLENLIQFEVLAREADRRGLGSDPEVIRTMKQVMIDKLMQSEFETRVKLEDITDAEIKKYYDDHISDFVQPEQVRVAAIVIKNAKSAARLMEEVKGPKGQDNRAFRDLVMQYSEDELSKARGGDLLWIDASNVELPKEVVRAALLLEKNGDVAGPIATAKGNFILKLTMRRPALSRSADDPGIRRQIQSRVFRDKRSRVMDDFVSGLRKNAKIEVFQDRVKRVQVDLASATVGGGDQAARLLEGTPGAPTAAGAPEPGLTEVAAGQPSSAESGTASAAAPPPAGPGQDDPRAIRLPPSGPNGIPAISPSHKPALDLDVKAKGAPKTKGSK